MNKKTVLFAGAYGIQNSGDDLPLLVMCEKLRCVYKRTEFDFRVISRHPNKWEENQFNVKMIKNLEFESRKKAKGKWFNGLNFGDDKTNLKKIRNEIKNCDLLVLGAGNFLIDKTIDLFRGPIPLFSLYVFLAKLYHIPIMLYGISVGPLKTTLGYDLSRYIIENSDIVTVRDSISRDQIVKMKINKKIHLLPDPVIGTEKPTKENIKRILFKEKILNKNKKLMAVGLRDLSNIVSSNTNQKILKSLIKFFESIKNEYALVFVPQSTYPEDDDRLFAKKFVKNLSNRIEYFIIKERYHPQNLIGIYEICDITLSIRLHSAVLSLIAGTPTISIGYLPKVEGFMKDMNLEEYCLNINSVNKSNLQKLHNKISNNQDLIKGLIKNKLKEKKKLIPKYAKFSKLLLEK